MPGADNFPVLKAGKAILLIDEGATGGVGAWGGGGRGGTNGRLKLDSGVERKRALRIACPRE